MNRSLLAASLAMSLTAAPPAPGVPVKAILGATLLNPGQKPVVDSVLLMQGSRILGAGSASQVKVPKDAERVNAKGKFLVPGLIDSHIHFFQSGGIYTRPDAIDLRTFRPYEQEMADIKERLGQTFARWLRCGVTSVIDFGGPMWNFEVRDLAAKTRLAPRVAICGPLITPGQPLHKVTGKPFEHFLTTGQDPSVIPGLSREQIRAEIARQARHQPDFIKVWAGPDLDLLKVIIEEGRKAGFRVAVHATKHRDAEAAVDAGAEVLVHGVADQEISDAFLKKLGSKKVIYIPTLYVSGGYANARNRVYRFLPEEHELADPCFLGSLMDPMHLQPPTTAEEISKLRGAQPYQVPEVQKTNLRKLLAAGVFVAAGTDAGNIGTLHGPSIFRELRLMREAGLSLEQILESVTIRGALTMGREKELGSLEEGKLADFVLLDADPLQDVGNYSRIHRVAKDGEILEPGQILKPSPSDLAQRQLNAYNARDVDAFVAAYTEDVELFTYPGIPIPMPGGKVGREGLRARYAKRFEQTPELHCRLLHRIVHDNFVVDHEEITTDYDKPEAKRYAVAVYDMVGELIGRAEFLNKPTAPKQ